MSSIPADAGRNPMANHLPISTQAHPWHAGPTKSYQGKSSSLLRVISTRYARVANTQKTHGGKHGKPGQHAMDKSCST